MGHRYLKRSLIPLQHYLGAAAAQKKLRLKNKQGELLPPLRIAWLRGEALLRMRFFTMLESNNITDPRWQLEIWQKLVESRGYILDFLQRVKLGQHIEGCHQQIDDGAFKLYCILLDTLRREGNEELLKIATDALFLHHIKTLFPKQTVVRRHDPRKLKHSALIKLRKYWGPTAQLKESFQTRPEQVEFQLRMKIRDHAWQVLVEVLDKRLKPARIQAYHQLIDGLREGRFRPQSLKLNALAPVVSRKSVR